ncbi:MmpS family transport accessory protein [Actinoplanes sp. NPDC049802]|uniref:MmpS family transport accessory protein n=1 Tax=Actinoplanes sp. NPDC049802 TaxID=3154742 RepID=UPI0033E33C35
MSDPSEPRQPPRPPQFIPGHAQPPRPDDNPPTSEFPPVNFAPPGYPPDYGAYPPPDPTSGYPPAGYPPAGYPQPGPPPPKRSNAPLIALILAVTLLLCGGVVTTAVILVQRAADKAEELAEPILEPTLPSLPSEAPEFPGLPTDFPELPGLPTDLPTELPGIGEGKEIEVTYEVTGDGPAEIIYVEQLGTAPKRVANAKLPWKITTSMKGTSLVSVVAVRTGTGAGKISCRASVDGEEIVKQNAEGGLATASCYKLVVN